MTTSEMVSIIEKLYGHHYSPATISNMTKLTEESVLNFHQRQLETAYTAVFLDATYLHLKRDAVAKEAVHIALGMTPSGQKEVLGYKIAPTENLVTWQELMNQLHSQGVEQVSLFVSDGFVGMEQLCKECFPRSVYQSCLLHLARNLSKKVRQADRAGILNSFKAIYQSNTYEKALKQLDFFSQRWSKNYPKAIQVILDNQNLLTFMQFPKMIWKSLYTTNSIENLNLLIKRQLRKKTVFQNEAAIERFLVTQFNEYHDTLVYRKTKGFSDCQDTLESLFD